MNTTHDSELESLQCYPFHLPEFDRSAKKIGTGLDMKVVPTGIYLFEHVSEKDLQKALGDSERWERLMRTGTYMSFKADDDEQG